MKINFTDSLVYTFDKHCISNINNQIEVSFNLMNTTIMLKIFDLNNFAYDDFIDNKQPLKLLVLDNFLWVLSSDFSILKNIRLPQIYKPISLVEKELIQYLLSCDYSENLLELRLDGEDYIDFFDDVTIYGDRIQQSYEFKKLLQLDEFKIIYLKMQPKKKNEVVTLRNSNFFEFSKYIEPKQQVETIVEFTSIIKKYVITKRNDQIEKDKYISGC